MATKNRAKKTASDLRRARTGMSYRLASIPLSVSTSHARKEAAHEGPAMLAQFLDLLWSDVEADSSKLISYTQELDAELSELLDGVEID